MSKALPRTSRLLVVLAVGVGACGGGGSGKGSQSYPDASTFGPGGTAGPGGSTSPTGGGGKGGTTAVTGNGGAAPGNGGATGSTAGAAGTSAPTAPAAAGSTTLLSGVYQLMGPGTTCSQPPAAAAGATAPDRWCGLFAVNAAGTGIALWVFDLTKAAAGTAITCTAGDANCLKVSDDIDTADSDASYGFMGQTLIYYDATSVYAWRPGWTAGRVLQPHSSTQPVGCGASSADVPTAICVAQTTGNAYAGTIDTQSGGPLPLIEALGSGSSGISFSPDSLSVIWSVNTSTTTPAETLKMQKIGDNTTRQTIASNVTSWTISADGTRWYWLSKPSTDANGFTTGTLQTAPYPAGTAPAGLQSKVWSYSSYGATGMVTLTNPALITSSTFGADMNAIPDIAAPTTSTPVEAKDVVGIVSLNNTGTIVYATSVVQPNQSSNNVLIDLRTINADGTGKCVVAATPVADVGATLNRTGSAVEWIQVTVDASGNATAIAGQVTPLAECAGHTFSTSLYAYTDVSSGLIVQQNLDSSSGAADVAYAPFAASGAAGTPTLVQTGADSVVVPLFPDPGRVLFTLNRRTTGNGLFLSPPILAGNSTTPLTAPGPRPLAHTASLAPGSLGAPFRPTAARLLTSGASVTARASFPGLVALSAPMSRPPQALRAFSPFDRGLRAARLDVALPRPARVSTPKAIRAN